MQFFSLDTRFANEAEFSDFLSVYLQSLGCRVKREAYANGGFVDLVVESSDQLMLVEAKMSRRDMRTAIVQLKNYARCWQDPILCFACPEILDPSDLAVLKENGVIPFPVSDAIAASFEGKNKAKIDNVRHAMRLASSRLKPVGVAKKLVETVSVNKGAIKDAGLSEGDLSEESNFYRFEICLLERLKLFYRGNRDIEIARFCVQKPENPLLPSDWTEVYRFMTINVDQDIASFHR